MLPFSSHGPYTSSLRRRLIKHTSIHRIRNLTAATLTLALLAGCGDPKPLRSTEVATRNIYSAALDSDSTHALIGAEFHGGALWRLADQERLFSWNHRQGEYTAMTASSFSPEGEWALTTDSKTLVLWNSATGAAERFWSSTADVLSVALGPNGDFALLGLTDKTAVIQAIKRGGILRNFQHAERVTSVALSENGTLALTGSEDRSAVIWNVETGEALHRQLHNDPVQFVALSRDGQRALSVAQYDSSILWNTATGATIWQLPVKKQWLRRGTTFSSARFSDDGVFLLSGSPGGLVQLWNIDEQRLVYEWRLPKRKLHQPVAPSILSLGFGEGGNRFYAISSDGFIHQLGY
jgi:WD40 repeat protein